MKILRSIAVAFSLYSRIPMPHFEWKDEDMKYNLVFLPWIGAIIGCLAYLIGKAGGIFDIPVLVITLIVSIVPLIITGGFHVDGFMDVCDALSSFKSREEKLNILKDPHIGAFAVISFAIYSAFWIAAVYLIIYLKAPVPGIIFFLSRAVGALTVNILPKAKKSGMLNAETKNSTKAVNILLGIEVVLGLTAGAYVDLVCTIVCVCVLILFLLHFRTRMIKEFGGVNGDTAGYFISLSELLMFISWAIIQYCCCVIPGR